MKTKRLLLTISLLALAVWAQAQERLDRFGKVLDISKKNSVVVYKIQLEEGLPTALGHIGKEYAIIAILELTEWSDLLSAYQPAIGERVYIPIMQDSGGLVPNWWIWRSSILEHGDTVYKTQSWSLTNIILHLTTPDFYGGAISTTWIGNVFFFGVSGIHCNLFRKGSAGDKY